MVLGWIIRTLYLVILTRTLGPEQYGTFVYGMTFYISIGVFTNFGQGLLFASRMSARPGTQHTLVAHSLTLTLSMIVGTVTIAFVFAWWFYGGTPLQWIISAFLGALMGRTIVGWVRACAVAIEDSRWLPRYELGFRLLELVIGVAVLIFDLGVLALVINHSVVWLIEAAMTIRLMRRRWSVRLRLGRDRRMLAAVGRVSITFLLNISGLHLFTQAGILTLQQVQQEPGVVGQFGLAMQIILTVMVLPTALAATVAPAIGRIRRSAGTDELAALARAVRLLIVVGGTGAVLATAYVPPLAILVFGEQYGPAANILAILCWALGPYSVALIACHALNALGRRGQAATIAMTMTVVHVAGIFVMPVDSTLVAAAISFVAAATIGSAAAMFSLGPRIGVPGQKWWAVPFALVGGAGALIYLLPVTPSITVPAIAAVLLVAAFGTGALAGEDLKFARNRFAGSS